MECRWNWVCPCATPFLTYGASAGPKLAEHGTYPYEASTSQTSLSACIQRYSWRRIQIHMTFLLSAFLPLEMYRPRFSIKHRTCQRRRGLKSMEADILSAAEIYNGNLVRGTIRFLYLELSIYNSVFQTQWVPNRREHSSSPVKRLWKQPKGIRNSKLKASRCRYCWCPSIRS